MNPGRDLVHAFANYMSRAAGVLQDPKTNLSAWFRGQGGTDGDVDHALQFVDRFMAAAADPENVKSLADGMRAAGYLELPLHLRLSVGHALFNVLLGAYFHGFREAVGGGRQYTDQIRRNGDSLVLAEAHAPAGVRGFARRALLALADRVGGRE